MTELEGKKPNIHYTYTYTYTIENKYLQIAKESLEIKNISERVAHVLNKMVEIQSLQSMSSGEIVNFSKILLLNCGIDKENIGKLD